MLKVRFILLVTLCFLVSCKTSPEQTETVGDQIIRIEYDVTDLLNTASTLEHYGLTEITQIDDLYKLLIHRSLSYGYGNKNLSAAEKASLGGLLQAEIRNTEYKEICDQVLSEYSFREAIKSELKCADTILVIEETTILLSFLIKTLAVHGSDINEVQKSVLISYIARGLITYYQICSKELVLELKNYMDDNSILEQVSDYLEKSLSELDVRDGKSGFNYLSIKPYCLTLEGGNMNQDEIEKEYAASLQQDTRSLLSMIRN